MINIIFFAYLYTNNYKQIINMFSFQQSCYRWVRLSKLQPNIKPKIKQMSTISMPVNCLNYPCVNQHECDSLKCCKYIMDESTDYTPYNVNMNNINNLITPDNGLPNANAETKTSIEEIVSMANNVVDSICDVID